MNAKVSISFLTDDTDPQLSGVQLARDDGGFARRASADGADHGGEQDLLRADAGRGVSRGGKRGEFRRHERLEQSGDADGGVSRGGKNFDFSQKSDALGKGRRVIFLGCGSADLMKAKTLAASKPHFSPSEKK